MQTHCFNTQATIDKRLYYLCFLGNRERFQEAVHMGPKNAMTNLFQELIESFHFLVEPSGEEQFR